MKVYEQREDNMTFIEVECHDEDATLDRAFIGRITLWKMFFGQGWTDSKDECADQAMRQYRVDYLSYKRQVKGKTDAYNRYIKMRAVLSDLRGLPFTTIEPKIAWTAIERELGHPLADPDKVSV